MAIDFKRRTKQKAWIQILMVSELIKKEKARQEGYLSESKHFDCYCEDAVENGAYIESHKQSLINLKEYMEEVIDNFDHDDFYNERLQIREDIKELDKMIEAYE